MNILDFKTSKPDPRVLIFLVIVVSVLSCMLFQLTMLYVLFLIVDILMLCQKMQKKAIRFFVVYNVLIVARKALTLISTYYISMIISMIIILLLHVIPIYMVCFVMFNKNHMNEMITALEHMKIPKIFIIPLAVVYRYIPTITEEISNVRISLKMRGLNTSVIGFIMHPVKMIENFMMPLLIRSAKIADELSAATLCKGLDLNNKRTCTTKVRFDFIDGCYCIAFICLAALIVFIDKNYLFFN
ncbi:cobalt transporter [Vallitalea longa]|uniref:Cobalt transporter n=1 Tax=Vallitalea longa TaxID=2936439 RepID=A0A9W5Y7P4_9FIRM|nr:energy-coupling factor transporter transmembrane component T [Vallitalea longa]GKX27764.1 cobalt transporter [Vallitalea longa]